MMWYNKLEKILTRILTGLLTLSFLTIIILIITLVVLRYLFNSTIIGANEFVVILFIFTSAIGATVVIGKNEHIAITYFIDKLPASYRRAVDVFNFLLVAFINGAMIWYSFNWIGTTGDYLTAILKIPQLYAQLIVPVGCGIAIIYCLFQIVSTLNSKRA